MVQGLFCEETVSSKHDPLFEGKDARPSSTVPGMSCTTNVVWLVAPARYREKPPWPPPTSTTVEPRKSTDDQSKPATRLQVPAFALREEPHPSAKAPCSLWVLA